MFQDLYKQNINENERQEIRRQKLLQQQKLKRLEQQDDHRDLEEPPSNIRSNKEVRRKRYQNTKLENISLQLSEWMKEKPEDLEDWLLVPCPKGQRCLVVSANGETKMFSKNKRYRMTFPSYLPGGGLVGSSQDCCIFDCVYNRELDTFYVLDVLQSHIPLMECDTEFRFFWLKSKFDEIEDNIDECDKDKVKHFHVLDFYDMANEERVAMALQKYPLWPSNQPELDGFLFYHKHSNYVCGTTPLVCWLFPFMIPDVLGMTIGSDYEIPSNYVPGHPLQYMEEFDKVMARKHNKRGGGEGVSKQMDFVNDIDLNKFQQHECSPANTTTTADMEDLDELQEAKENSLKSLINAERLLELEEFVPEY